MDELRTFYLLRKKTVPLLLSRFSYEDIKRRLPYLFREKSKDISLAAQLDFHILEDKRGKTLFQGIPLTYMTYEQGGMEVNGYRIGNFAYVSDIRNYPETIFEDLKGVKTLVLSALKFTPTQMHFSLEEASSFAKKIGAEQTFFMHIAHEMEHEKANATLPPE